MGYESKIYIVERSDFSNFAPIIASIDIGKIGCCPGFYELFTHWIDYDVYIDSQDEPTTEDCYGDHLKDASLADVLGWFDELVNIEQYRRLLLLYRLLEAFTIPDEWDIEQLRIIHYGH